MKMCYRIISIFIAAILSLAVFGCHRGSQGTAITVYTALESELVDKYLESFRKLHPDINVRIVRESTGIITARLLAERDNPQADVIWGTAASSMLILDEQGLLEPYSPEGAERILPMFKSSRKIPTWIGLAAWETAFVVNLPELARLGLDISQIQSYDDLLRPELRGHVTMPNPNSSGTGLLTIAGLLQIMDKNTDAGWDYLTRLHENISMYTHSGSRPARMAASGECVVGISFGYAGVTQKARGAPVAVVFPREGSGWDLEANALVRRENINPKSKVFLDWAISEPKMALVKEVYPIITTGQGGTYEGIAGNPVDQLIDNDLAWIASNRETMLNRWMTLFNERTEAR